MTENSNLQPSKRSPWRQAVREARAIALVSIVVAVTYNLFAATSIPWLREVKEKDSTAQKRLEAILAEEGGNPAGGEDGDTVAAVQLDTAQVPQFDTASAPGLTQAQIDSLNQWRKDSLKLARQESIRLRDSARRAEAETLLTKLKSAKVTDINTEVAKKLYDAKAAVFIDARPEDQYNAGHISGSMNVYAEQWQSKIPEIIQIAKEQPIICYCSGGDECELSHDLAKSLQGLGYLNVFVYTGGIQDWTAKKYPLVTPKK